jgi:hypothetical protein
VDIINGTNEEFSCNLNQVSLTDFSKGVHGLSGRCIVSYVAYILFCIFSTFVLYFNRCSVVLCTPSSKG